MSHATLIVFIFSLVIGVAGISLLNELYRRHGRVYLRAGVWQLVLFNLVLLGQLLYSYYSLNLAAEGDAAVRITICHLAASSPLKLFWVVLLGIMGINLLGMTVSIRAVSNLRALATGLALGMLILAVVALRTLDPRPLFRFQAVVEMIVVLGILGITVFLLIRHRRVRVAAERRLARDFGLTLLVIWLPVVISILLGSRLWPNSNEFRLFIHSLLLLGFNLIPFLLLRGRLPELPPFQAGREPDWHDLIGKFGITPREREIIELICRGKRNQEIADELFISLQTVKDHNYRIFRKLGVKTRVQVANLVRGDNE